MLPCFICIGAQRAGTTWVYNCLKQHPEIFLSEKKELQYFNAFYDRGRGWYESNFIGAQEGQKIGEVTPNYLHADSALDRLSNDIPDAKLFIILRNPYERAYSAYRLFHNNLCKGMTFTQAYRNEKAIIKQSLYADVLNKVYNLFPEEHVKIFLYDDLKKDNNKLLKDLYDFIGVSDDFIPGNLKVQYNKIMFPKIQKILMKYHMEWIINGVKRSALNAWIRKTYQRIEKKSQNSMSEEDVKCLNQFFVDDIYKTQKIIGRSLEHWLNNKL